MTKIDIINLVSEDTGLSKVKAGEAVETIIDTIKESLEAGESVILRRFGSFQVRNKNARVGPQPQDGRGGSHLRAQGRALQGGQPLQGSGERRGGELLTEALVDQHGVPVGVETIPLPHRLGVGAQHVLPACERRDEHEQGRARQVEVREHGGPPPGSENPGRMNRPARNSPVLSRCPSAAWMRADSSVRTTVVPTASTRPPCALVSSTARAVSSGRMQRSDSILWSSKSCARTGVKVPAPTWRVRRARRAPVPRMAPSSSSLRCRPAVGAATAPGRSAKTVW